MLAVLDWIVMGGGVLIAAFLLFNMVREMFTGKDKMGDIEDASTEKTEG